MAGGDEVAGPVDREPEVGAEADLGDLLDEEPVGGQDVADRAQVVTVAVQRGRPLGRGPLFTAANSASRVAAGAVRPQARQQLRGRLAGVGGERHVGLQPVAAAGRGRR